MKNRIDLTERFAEMWRTSREDAGKSQEYMARALGVSKKTVQNWEQGTSCPSQLMGFEWFIVLGVQPLPYYLRLLYPEEFMGTEHGNTDKTDALIRVICDLSPDLREKLFYLICGDHGSSVLGIAEMVTAHLQTPLKDRLSIAVAISTNYELAEAAGKLRCPESVQPNMDMLMSAIEKGKQAVKEGKEEYTTIEKGI